MNTLAQSEYGETDVHLPVVSRKVDVILRVLHINPAEFDDLVPPSVRSLIASGHMIHAIKEYRDLTSSSLKEARDIVVKAVDSEVQPSWVVLNRKLDRILAEMGVDHNTTIEPGLTRDQTMDVENMIRAGNLIAAVMEYRDHTGASLEDAQAAVYRIAARLREESDSDT